MASAEIAIETIDVIGFIGIATVSNAAVLAVVQSWNTAELPAVG